MPRKAEPKAPPDWDLVIRWFEAGKVTAPTDRRALRPSATLQGFDPGEAERKARAARQRERAALAKAKQERDERLRALAARHVPARARTPEDYGWKPGAKRTPESVAARAAFKAARKPTEAEREKLRKNWRWSG